MVSGAIADPVQQLSVQVATLHTTDASLLRHAKASALPILYLPADPTVVMALDALPPSVGIDPGTGTFTASAWAQELLPLAVALGASGWLAHALTALASGSG